MTSPLVFLRQEQTLIAALLAVLKEEQQHLVGADAERLAELTPRKADLVQQLATLAAQRHAALGAAGFAAEEAGMEPWLAVAGNDEAAGVWRDVLDQTRAAKELNRVNGMLITKQMTHTQVLLTAMRTPTAAAEAGVYGPSGQTNFGGPSRRYVLG